METLNGQEGSVSIIGAVSPQEATFQNQLLKILNVSYVVSGL